MPTTYLALLRGINVGGKHSLPMSDLRDIFSAADCRDVRTYIQSGNVIFAAEPAVAALVPDRVAEHVRERFGFAAPLVLRTAEQLGEIIRQNPFLAEGAPEDTLHVLFLAGSPSTAALAALDPRRSLPDRFIARGQEVYLQLPKGVARTKLTNGYFDTTLATTGTLRNWRTVTTLLGLMEGT